MVFLATDIPLGESLIIALTGYATIFVVLVVLLFLLKGLTSFSAAAGGSGNAAAPDVQIPQVAAAHPEASAAPSNMVPAKGSIGEIKLNDVDDKTAALVMAVVADELKAPLNELRFTSIRKK